MKPKLTNEDLQSNITNLIGLRRFDEALTLCSKLEDKLTALQYKAAIESTRNNKPVAIKYLKEVLTKSSHDNNVSKATHYNLGTIYCKLGDYDNGIQHLTKSFNSAGFINQASIHYSLGYCYYWTGRYQLAITEFQQVLKLADENDNVIKADTYNCLALAHLSIGLLDEAEQYIDKALTIKSTLGHQVEPKYLYTQSQINLHKGDWAVGLEDYEFRNEIEPKPLSVEGVSKWNGEPLDKKNLLIVHERGYGDTIQMLRFSRYIHNQYPDAHITWMVPNDLYELAKLTDADEVIPVKRFVSGYDYWIPAMSLPRVLKIRPDNLNSSILTDPYIESTGYGKEIRRLFNPSARHTVGVVWQGHKDEPYDFRRSVNLNLFEPLSKIEGIQLISLQKGYEAEKLPSWIKDGSRFLTSWVHTASTIEQLDLIISVDTAVAHLAGALGKPVCILLPYLNDWRWGWRKKPVEGWYPTATLFYQEVPGVWQTVFNELYDYLSED